MHLFNDTHLHINFLLYKTEAGKTEWGISRREGERERKMRIMGVRDGA